MIYSSIQYGIVYLCFAEDTQDDIPLFATQVSPELPDFMNGPVKNMLGIIPPEVTWLSCKLSIHRCLLLRVKRRRFYLQDTDTYRACVIVSQIYSFKPIPLITVV